MELRHKLLLVFTASYILGFAIYYIRDFNIEFLAYVGVLMLGFFLVAYTYQSARFPFSILCALSIWGLLHMAGGSIKIDGGVLYGYHIYPFVDRGGEFFILRMDQVIHMFGFGTTALVVHHLIERFFKKDSVSRFWLSMVAVSSAMGLGALNEMIEFSMVVITPNNGVGGYFNTLLDLVFNTVGALIALSGLHLVRYYRKIYRHYR